MHGRSLPLVLGAPGTEPAHPVMVRQAVVAGWTGRNRDAVNRHIAELEALGVRPPSTTPIFYRVSAARVTVDDVIEVSGSNSSGEVEFVLLQAGGRLWLGVGSDHTDRQVEAYNVTVSKQMCDKPIAPRFWPFDDVLPHWSCLTLRSYVGSTETPELYQEGNVDAMLDPSDLISRFTGDGNLPEGTLMFCGTLAAHGGVRPSERFTFEIEDPVLGRRIRHQYTVSSLPVME